MMSWNPRDDTGAGLIEWVLLVVLIAIVALVAVQYTGTQNSLMWSEIASAVS